MALNIEDRFRDRRYMNWLKAIWGLDSVRKALLGITEEKIRKFHTSMKKKPCCGSCRTEDLGPGGAPKQALCEKCNPWVIAIAGPPGPSHPGRKTGISSDDFGCIWPNTDVKTWNTNYWEIAKVFMYITDAKKTGTGKISTGPDMDDCVKLLHLCLNCKLFDKEGQDKEKIQAVIDIRNELMHSPTPTLEDDVTDHYLQVMTALTSVTFLKEKSGAVIARHELEKFCYHDAFPYELEKKSTPRGQRPVKPGVGSGDSGRHDKEYRTHLQRECDLVNAEEADNSKHASFKFTNTCLPQGYMRQLNLKWTFKTPADEKQQTPEKARNALAEHILTQFFSETSSIGPNKWCIFGHRTPSFEKQLKKTYTDGELRYVTNRNENDWVAALTLTVNVECQAKLAREAEENAARLCLHRLREALQISLKSDVGGKAS